MILGAFSGYWPIHLESGKACDPTDLELDKIALAAWGDRGANRWVLDLAKAVDAAVRGTVELSSHDREPSHGS